MPRGDSSLQSLSPDPVTSGDPIVSSQGHKDTTPPVDGSGTVRTEKS